MTLGGRTPRLVAFEAPEKPGRLERGRRRLVLRRGIRGGVRRGVIRAREIPGASGDASEIDALQLERLQDHGAYAIAASFVSWLRSETDARAFAEAFAGPPYAGSQPRDELETWFASALGRSLADGEAVLRARPRSH